MTHLKPITKISHQIHCLWMIKKKKKKKKNAFSAFYPRFRDFRGISAKRNTLDFNYTNGQKLLNENIHEQLNSLKMKCS